MRLVHGRRAVNQRALTKANRRNEVNQAHVKELIAAAFHFEGDVLVRIAGRQGVKRGAVRHRISGAAVDLGDVEHGGVLVAVALGTYRSRPCGDRSGEPAPSRRKYRDCWG